MKKTHIEWIDWAKVIAIFAVVLLHTHCNPTLDRYINAFLLPSFFFMSGYLFSFRDNGTFRRFAAKRFRQLVLPYLWINVLAYLCWLTVLRHYGADATQEIDPTYPLTGIVSGVPAMLIHDIPLWSLLSFFVVEMIYYPIGRHGLPGWLTVAIFATGGWALTLISDGGRLPLTIGPSVMGVAFYAAGHLCRTNGIATLFSRPWVLASASTGFAISTACNGTVEFYRCLYGNCLLFLLAAALGIISLTGITMHTARLFSHEPKLIRLAAWGTLIICGFHLLVFAAIKGVALFVFGINPDVLTDGISHGLPFAAAAFAISTVIATAIHRYLPRLIGK